MQALHDHRPRPAWQVGKAANLTARIAWTKQVNAVYSAFPASPEHPKFTLFSDSQAKVLQETYRQDIDTLRRRWPGMLIEPGGLREGD